MAREEIALVLLTSFSVSRRVVDALVRVAGDDLSRLERSQDERMESPAGTAPDMGKGRRDQRQLGPHPILIGQVRDLMWAAIRSHIRLMGYTPWG